jgi:hypothetical protein
MAINENLLARKVAKKVGEGLKTQVPIVWTNEMMRCLFEQLYKHPADDILALVGKHKPK